MEDFTITLKAKANENTGEKVGDTSQFEIASDAITVTSCARANGFHHMGEFARLYRAAFHEPASRTLARARGLD